MRTAPHKLRRTPAVTLALAAALLVTAPAAAQTGGAAAPPEAAPAPEVVPGSKAKLKKNGRAVAPANAPQQVIDAIAAANRIRKKPYIYGGGHKSFTAKGYDCSGAVSYVLNAAGLLDSPLPSGSLMKWGEPGKGAWISVYANGGHAYAVDRRPALGHLGRERADQQRQRPSLARDQALGQGLHGPPRRRPLSTVPAGREQASKHACDE